MLRSYTSRVETGYTIPSLETLERFATALDVPVYQFFCDAQTGQEAEVVPVSDQDPTDRFIRVLKGYVSSLRNEDRQLLLDLARRLAKKEGGSERRGPRDLAATTKPRHDIPGGRRRLG